MRIVWDERKREANRRKHGLDFSSLTFEFFENAIVRPARDQRMIALGWLDGTLVVAVVFRPLGSEAILIVSMRPASARERWLREQER